jgi:hypothetical protein
MSQKEFLVYFPLIYIKCPNKSANASDVVRERYISNCYSCIPGEKPALDQTTVWPSMIS